MKAVWNLKRNDMKIRYDACLSEVSINMPYKEARAFLTALDKVRNHTSNSEQYMIVADFEYMLGRFLQDI